MAQLKQEKMWLGQIFAKYLHGKIGPPVELEMHFKNAFNAF
jgi:hypothetical protein